MSAERKVALVLAGGGARGAYEAGALRYILTELSPALRRPTRFHIICGTSAGALNGAFLAGTGDHAETARALSSIWRSMEISQVFNFTALEMLRSPSRLWQRPPANGAEQSALLDAAPLHALVKRMFPAEGLRRRLSSGELLALAVSATEVATGRNLIFLQRHHPGPHEDIPYAQMVMRESTLAPEHVLASAAIPFLFPPVEVDGRYFVDGALRQNTPLSPALRLGAEKVLVIGVKRSFTLEPPQLVEEADRPPSLTFLMGKALNALTLDPLERDLKAVERYNALF
ncbi:patatin-like phospholipase family protein, partial [Myxococcota bacterium]|nr:patatin-like phospholipase family protein [Myxococcota bacterium]